MEITRWDEHEDGHGMVTDENGFYVRYDDHIKIVKELEAKIQSMKYQERWHAETRADWNDYDISTD